ncbi:MAG: histidine phosphatase family protein [Planctomycetia bacterium]|nr:histidine phosphatase family protein [Planctomycetia bacterium]
MLLYCIRHGETTYNAEGRIQGQLDTPLSDLGRRQSLAVAKALASLPIELIVSSPLARAYTTAEPLAKALGVDIRTDDRLKEINAGIFQNLVPSEMAERFPEETASWKSHDPDYRIPQGESRRELMMRGAAALADLLHSPLKTAAVVAHGGLLTAAFKGLLGIPAERSPFMLYNGSINVLEFTGQIRLMSLNQIDHLRDADGTLQSRLGDL